MPLDLPPTDFYSHATQEVAQAKIAQAVPNGTPWQDVGQAFSQQGFSCKQSTRKLVCRLERKKGFMTKEAWIIAFDLDDTGRVKDKRVSHGYIAP